MAPDGTIYFGTLIGIDGGDTGTLWALNPDGTKKWAMRRRSWIQSSPVVAADGTIYVCDRDGQLLAVSAEGKRVWTYDTGEVTWQSSPAIGPDGTIYFDSSLVGRGDLNAVATNGRLKWKLALDGGMDNTPAIGEDGTVYVASGDGALHAVNPNGQRKWDVAVSEPASSSGSSPKSMFDGTGGGVGASSPAVGLDGTVYVCSGSRLVAVAASGSKSWEATQGGFAQSAPAIGGDGTVYFVSSNGSRDPSSLSAFDSHGRKLWTLNLGPTGATYGETSPVIGRGRTICVSGNRALTSIGDKP